MVVAKRVAKKVAPARRARTQGRPAAIVPVADDNPHVNFMVFGPPGAGKTVLAGSSPRCLIFCHNPDEVSSAKIQGSKANRWHIPDYNDFTEGFEYVRYHPEEFDWVWLDNGTLFQEQGLDQIMLDLVAAKSHRNQFIPDKAEYGENQNRLSWLIREFVKLPVNFGVTAHVMRMWDDDSDVPTLMPSFQGGQGKLSQTLCGYMGVVMYMKARKTKEGVFSNYGITDPRKNIHARDRYSALGGIVHNPTIPKMMEIINKARSGQPTKTVRKTVQKRSQ